MAFASLLIGLAMFLRLDAMLIGNKRRDPSASGIGVDIGQAVPLDEAGFRVAVATAQSLRNQEVMRTFITRIGEKEGLRVVDDNALRAFGRYFDGECSTQSYGTLLFGLHEAARRPLKCGGGWLELLPADNASQAGSTAAFLELKSTEYYNATTTGVLRNVYALRMVSNSSVAEVGYKTVAVERDDAAMKRFIRGTIAVLGGQVLNEGDLSGFVHWYSGCTAVQSFHRLVQELGEISQKPSSWINFPGGSPLVEADVSQTATFDEDGYAKVSATNDEDRMALYIHRLAEAENLKVSHENVQDMIKWYIPECGTQSFASLREELHRSVEPKPSQPISCGGWKPFSDERPPTR